MSSNQDHQETKGFHQFKRDADVSSFPLDFANYIKSFGDLYYWPQGKFYVITKADDAMKLLRDPCH